MIVLLASAILVFVFSGLMAMAGLGAAFLFVPMFYYMGVPVAEAVATALLLNVVSLFFAAVNYWRGGLVDFRIGLPVLVTAVLLAPLGARMTAEVNTQALLWMFTAFLVLAGAMMLFYRPASLPEPLSRGVGVGVGLSVGGVAGFLGGLLGVGGGNFIVPVLNWLGLDAKVAAGTTALVVIFASFSGFLGHATVGNLNPGFLGVTAVMAAAGSIAGSQLMKHKLSSAQLKRIIGVLLWLIAAKMIFDLLLM